MRTTARLPFRRLAVATALFPLLLAIGCGGAQRLDPDSTPPWSERLLDVVPADASFVLVRDFDERDTALLESSAGRTLAQLNAPATLMLQAIERETGVVLDRERGLEQFGVDPAGGIALYVRAMAPIVIFRIEDEAQYDLFVKQIVAASPDVPFTSWSADGIPFQRALLQDHVRLDIGRRGSFGILRLAMTTEGVELADRHLREAVRGIPLEQRFSQTPEGRDIAGRLGDTAPQAIGLVRAQFISDLVAEFMRRAGASYMLGQPEQDLDALYGTPERRAQCQAEANRLIAMAPWSGFATSPSVEGVRDSVALVRLSPDAEQGLRRWFPGALQNLDTLAEDAAIVGTARADLQTIWDDLAGDATFAGCPDLALVSGLLGFVRAEVGRQVDFNLNLFDGNAGIVLKDARIVGFAPFLDVAVMLGSPDPPRLTNIIQNRLRSMGGGARLVPGASVTTIEIRVLHLRLRIMQLQDRLVLSLGSMPQRTLLELANGQPADNGDSLLLRWSGEAMRPILARANSYVAGTGMIHPELEPTVDDLMRLLYATDDARLSLGFEQGALTIRTHTRVNPVLLDQPLPSPDDSSPEPEHDDESSEDAEHE